MAKFIPVEPEKWAEMVKAAAASDYWRIEAETDHARWLRTLEENEKLRAEVERLTNNCDCLDRELDREIDKTAMLCGQVERLRKAGDFMQKSMLECGPNEMADAFHHDEWWASYNGWTIAKSHQS